ncbi:MAG: recombinase family protein [Alphaproteobacteria bacterium]|nr:recombinase family protein [Alphaproteobacteria bacterium]
MNIGYARVSTDDQDTAMQRDALSAAGCERIFAETASGARVDRVELKAAIDFARSGDTIVVWKLDRLARSLAQLIETVERLAERGVGIRSLTETIDSTSAGGKLIFHIFGALAEFERAVIRERTNEGLRAAARRGRFGGRPKSMSQADLAVARTLLADPAIPVADIARRLNISPATLYRHLPGGKSALDSASL